VAVKSWAANTRQARRHAGFSLSKPGALGKGYRSGVRSRIWFLSTGLLVQVSSAPGFHD